MDHNRRKPLSHSKAIRISEEVGGSVAGTILGLIAAGPVGAIAGSTVGVLASIAAEALERKRERAAAMLEVAQRESGMSIDELVAKLVVDEKRLGLLINAIAAAADSTVPRKIDSLARAISKGARAEDHEIENMNLIVKILALLDLPHIHVLHQISRRAPGSPVNPGWTPDELLDALPQHAIIMRPLVRLLELQGLIADAARLDPINLGGSVFWNVTELGALCLRLLYGHMPSSAPGTKNAS